MGGLANKDRKQRERRAKEKQAEADYAINNAVFWMVTEVCKKYKHCAPIVACTYGDGHNIKLNSTAVEYLADVMRITNAATSDLEYRVWIGLVERGEVHVQADNVKGLSIEDIRELSTHQVRLVQKLGSLYRKHGLQPRKYFKKTENRSGYTVAVG